MLPVCTAPPPPWLTPSTYPKTYSSQYVLVLLRVRKRQRRTASQSYSADADYSPTAWLIHRTCITKGAARGHRVWARRAVTHPRVVAALAEGTVLSESMAAMICQWTDRLPESCRDAADEILVAAARAGARKEDLAALAAEIYARSLPDQDDDLVPGCAPRPASPVMLRATRHELRIALAIDSANLAITSGP